jgi:hypothetical protein
MAKISVRLSVRAGAGRSVRPIDDRSVRRLGSDLSRTRSIRTTRVRFTYLRTPWSPTANRRPCRTGQGARAGVGERRRQGRHAPSEPLRAPQPLVLHPSSCQIVRYFGTATPPGLRVRPSVSYPSRQTVCLRITDRFYCPTITLIHCNYPQEQPSGELIRRRDFL